MPGPIATSPQTWIPPRVRNPAQMMISVRAGAKLPDRPQGGGDALRLAPLLRMRISGPGTNVSIRVDLEALHHVAVVGCARYPACRYTTGYSLLSGQRSARGGGKPSPSPDRGPTRTASVLDRPLTRFATGGRSSTNASGRRAEPYQPSQHRYHAGNHYMVW